MYAASDPVRDARDLLDRGWYHEAAALALGSLHNSPPQLQGVLWNLVGVCRIQLRDLAGAIDAFRTALAHSPELAGTRSNLLAALHFGGTVAPDDLFAAHLEWAAIHASGHKAQFDHANDPSPDRKIRIGYVSSDFRAHATSFFISPVLANHDRAKFEIFCLSSVSKPDSVTEKLKASEVNWLDISGQDDASVAALIRAREIDILVDMHGHQAGNRLPVFAQKPAPVQATWLAYPDTTGLRSVDYSITDAILDPLDIHPVRFTEQLAYMPGAFCCYEPFEQAPPIEHRSVTASGWVTFGSFSNPLKITPAVVGVWSEILRRVPRSLLMLHHAMGVPLHRGLGLVDGELRERLLAWFARNGITGDRIQLIGALPLVSHLQLYNHVDVALDPFPFSGVTTTCDALSMGVPVVTLLGRTRVGRVSASLVTAGQFPQFIGKTESAYVDIAVALAQASHGRESRIARRSRVSSSPLFDGLRFTRELEGVYRTMWHHWLRRG